MPYVLGIDLGCTRTSAAVLRGTGAPVPVLLGEHAASVPTALFVDANGAIYYGDTASARGLGEPDRMLRQFLGRIGDDVPMIGPAAEGTRAYRPHLLAGAMAAWVVARVTEREGDAPQAVSLTVPTAWGVHKRDLLRRGLATYGLPDAVLVDESESAVRVGAHAMGLRTGDTVAVVDLGGTTFKVAVVTIQADRPPTVLVSKTLPGLGGVDFDDALLTHVLAQLPGCADRYQEDYAAAALLRAACVQAKEQLSTDREVAVDLGNRTIVPVRRTDFEALARKPLARALTALDQTLTRAGIPAKDLTCVLLCGGSANIPTVARTLSMHLGGVSLARDADPALTAAGGAAFSLRATPGTFCHAAPKTDPARADGELRRPRSSRSWIRRSLALGAITPADGTTAH